MSGGLEQRLWKPGRHTCSWCTEGFRRGPSHPPRSALQTPHTASSNLGLREGVSSRPPSPGVQDTPCPCLCPEFLLLVAQDPCVPCGSSVTPFLPHSTSPQSSLKRILPHFTTALSGSGLQATVTSRTPEGSLQLESSNEKFQMLAGSPLSSRTLEHKIIK